MNKNNLILLVFQSFLVFSTYCSNDLNRELANIDANKFFNADLKKIDSDKKDVLDRYNKFFYINNKINSIQYFFNNKVSGFGKSLKNKKNKIEAEYNKNPKIYNACGYCGFYILNFGFIFLNNKKK